MISLICLVKGHSVDADKFGYVRCPNCNLAYCYDKGYIRRGRLLGGWRVCIHGDTCGERRLHKGRNDTKKYFFDLFKKTSEK